MKIRLTQDLPIEESFKCIKGRVIHDVNIVESEGRGIKNVAEFYINGALVRAFHYEYEILKTEVFPNGEEYEVASYSEDIEIKRETVEYPSSRVVFFNCPWCHQEIKAYVWSLSGSGKKCGCGAMFSKWGARKKLEQVEL